jgi:tetratricopeptide (TPR) repeat protein
VDAGVRLAGALWRFWDRHGHLREGRAWLDAALALRGGETREEATSEPRPTEGTLLARATALNGAGVLAYRQGDYARATQFYEESAALRRRLGDARGAASTLNNLALVARARGAYEQAEAYWQDGLDLLPADGDGPTAGAARDDGHDATAGVADQRVRGLILGNLATLFGARGEEGRSWRSASRSGARSATRWAWR